MAGYYANITTQGPAPDAVAAFLNGRGTIAFVAPGQRDCTVVFQEDLAAQEQLGVELSAHFQCPALVVMGYSEAVLLYHLYVTGRQADAYVSSPHDGLELEGPAPEGDARVLCGAFGIEMDHLVQRVERILRKPTRPNSEYAYAVNRHGELARALGLPLFAAGAGFNSIEVGELPEGAGFEASKLVRTGR